MSDFNKRLNENIYDMKQIVDDFENKDKDEKIIYEVLIFYLVSETIYRTGR